MDLDPERTDRSAGAGDVLPLACLSSPTSGAADAAGALSHPHLLPAGHRPDHPLKAFRRLKHKTQVFLEPEGDHYRTRMTHTIEVSRIARTIARGLRLNEDLTEAVALRPRSGPHPLRPRRGAGAQ